jgi:hypothetical protein
MIGVRGSILAMLVWISTTIGLWSAEPELATWKPTRATLPDLPSPYRQDPTPLHRTSTANEEETKSNEEENVEYVSAIFDPALGYAGPSRIRTRSGSNFEYDTVEDRYRIGFPEWDRYGQGHPRDFEYPYELGRWFDPYNLNVLKGDYPIFDQDKFFILSGTATHLVEGRRVPSITLQPNRDFFGRSNQIVNTGIYSLSFDLFKGDAAYKPADWRVKITPAFGVNAVNPPLRRGTPISFTTATLQEWFAEYKIADLSSQFDFISIRVGAQPFNSDFRGFIFNDTNRGVRLFGNLDGNRIQYNLAFFRQLEKDNFTQLNTFIDRDQNIVIANIFRQDFLFPGYNVSTSFHYNNDGPGIELSRNGALVRPDPIGVFNPHRVESYYLGLTGDGHIDRISLSHAFYWVLGRDSFNPIAGKSQSISGQMAALELSYTWDWARLRMSGFWASGDKDPTNGTATGFDGIIENMNFGGPFSFWRRQRLPFFGLGLKNDQSLYPDLRSSRLQGQSNFVNPGLLMPNLGADFDVTPKLRILNNANFLWFDNTDSLKLVTQQLRIDSAIGLDLSTGFEYRPFLNNNVIFVGGFSALVPANGFRQIYSSTNGSVPSYLPSGFIQMTLAF